MSPIVQAKLEPPRIRSGFVARPSLLARLEEAFRGHLTLVSAAAGYGKSTLIAQWLAGPSAPAFGWISLDSLDGDLERFMRYVVAALRRIEPNCLTRTERLLSADNFPSPVELAETMAAELEGLGERVVLVLDDYYTVRGGAVHELLRSLVPRLRETLHLVVLTRVDPPLPISLWLSRHWAHELRAADLRFTREETRTFFEAAERVRLSDRAVETIHQKTEGWIAGLRLAEMSLVGAENVEELVSAFSGTDHLVADYLMEQALAIQAPEVREFLALTAPLGRFNADLCDHLGAASSSRQDSRALLQHVYRSNMFTISLDPARGWYRYHHLFRQLLLDRFDEFGSSLSQEEIARRAGQWFVRERWLEEGMQLLLAAGEVDEAAGVVADNLHEVIGRDLSRRTLERWLALFPAGAERGRLPLIIAALFVKVRGFDLEGALDLFEVAENTCSGPEDEARRRWWRDLQPDLDSLRAHADFFLGRPAKAGDHALRALGSAEPGSYSHSIAAVILTGSLALSGSRVETLQFIKDGVQRASAGGDVHLWPYLLGKTASHLYWGELESCRRAALDLTENRHNPSIPNYIRSHGIMFLGFVAYERDDLGEAEEHFRAVRLLRFDTNLAVYHEALLGLAQVCLARGELERTEHYAAEARACVRDARGSYLRRLQASFDWRLEAATGRVSSAPSRPPSTADFTSVFTYTPSWNWAWARLHEPEPESRSAALTFIDEAIDLAEKHGVERRVIQFQVLRAVALEGLARRGEAVAALDDACRRAERLGFVRAFLDGGEAVHRVMQAAVRRDAPDAFVAKLLRAFKTSAESAGTAEDTAPSASAGNASPSRSGRARSAAAASPAKELTNRELDVLELLERRLSNKEIAGSLGVSAATVKSHTLGIYRKLCVEGRRAAVAEARALGILGRRRA